MVDAQFEIVSAHVDRFTPDDRTDRPVLGAIHGEAGTLLVEGGASVKHLREFLDELTVRNRPPVVGIALTHWHWDHSFGSAAIDVPVIGHSETAAELAVQAGYDWSDEALDQRVADGREIAFCREHIKLEIPDRSDLRIVVPTEIVAERHTVDLGGVTAEIEHVGGDHASDSCVIYVPQDRALFLGDCLYQCLHTAGEPYLTIAGVRALTERLARYDVELALEGHDDNVQDAAGFATRLADLRAAADLVERDGAAAELINEDVEFLISGLRGSDAPARSS